MTLSIVHKQYHGQKCQKGQWSSVEKDIKDKMILNMILVYDQNGQNDQMVKRWYKCKVNIFQ